MAAQKPEILNWKPHKGPQEQFHLTFGLGVYEVLFGGTKGPGKAQTMDSLVCTPFGFKRMGDVRVGDQVSNPDGSVARVIGIYPQGVKEAFRVSFDDGAACEVTGDHLWKYKIVGSTRFRKKNHSDRPTEWRIGTTDIIRAGLAEGRRPLIPLTEPVEFTITSRNSVAKWPIDAYALGALLGDGCLTKATIELSSHETHQAEEMVGGGVVVTRRTDQKSYGVPGVREPLAKLGLLGCVANTKFIPEAYKNAPLSLRWRLVQGLMDTDGFACKDGSASFTTVSPKLAKDVQWVSRSLGFKSNITTKVPTYSYLGEKRVGQLAYTVWIKGNEHSTLFTLPRKVERCRGKLYNGGNGNRTRKIVSIESVGQKEAQCIKVDNPNGLYITDDFVVTHNTDAILREGLRQIHIPGYRAIIFRRTYPRLGEIIDRSFKYFKLMGATYSDKDISLKLPAWTFPSGAKYAFGHCQNEPDKYNYQGKEFHYMGFDQVEEFTEAQYLFLMAQNRTSDPNITCYIRNTANPGGVGHAWVKKRYIDCLEAGVPKHFKRVEDEDIEVSKDDPSGISRAFVPASVYDNPSIIQNDPNYLRRLEQLPEAEKQALLYGNWEVFSGQFFKMWRKHYHVQERGIDKELRKFISLDYGYGAPSCALWWQSDYDGNLHAYRELYREGLTYEQLAHLIREKTPNDERIDYLVADPAIWGDKAHHKQAVGESGAESMGRVLHGFTTMVKADNSRITGWGRMRIMLQPNDRGQVKMTFSSKCVNVIRTLPTLIHDQTNVEDMNCFVAGTMVETINGPTPIETIPTGTLVKTPIGIRPVIWSGISGYSKTCVVSLSDGSTLEGTPNHKIFIVGKGLVELQDLISGDRIVREGDICLERLSGLTGSSLRGENTGSQTERFSQKAIQTFIGKFGKAFMEKSQMVSRSITKTTTSITTPSKTLSLSSALHMPDTTQFFVSKKAIYKKSSRLGELPWRANNNSEEMLTRCESIHRKENLRAKIVAELLKPGTLEPLFAQNVVNRMSNLFVTRKSVLSAEMSLDSKRTENEQRRPVHIVAVGFSENKKLVYNLTVEEAHLYYANGFLVTNTEGEDHAADSARYGCMSRPLISEKPVEKPQRKSYAWWIDKLKRTGVAA